MTNGERRIDMKDIEHKLQHNSRLVARALTRITQ